MNNNFIQVTEDAELELMVGGGAGYFETLTKDCPHNVSEVCVGVGIFQVCKSCE